MKKKAESFISRTICLSNDKRQKAPTFHLSLLYKAILLREYQIILSLFYFYINQCIAFLDSDIQRSLASEVRIFA